MMAQVTGISDREIYFEVAKEVCRCGESKRPGRTFCKKCYYKLPDELRDRLYQRKGRVLTYRESIAVLDK